MMHRKFYHDETGVFRPDLREEGVVAFAAMDSDSATAWVSLGPAAGVPSGGTALPISGLVADIAAQDLDNAWFGTRWSGVWRTTDRGVSWTSLGDALPSLQTAAVAVSPSGAVAYCAMGDLDDGRLIRTAGLSGMFRSVDGGRTWYSVDGGLGATRFRSVDVNQIVAVDDQIVLVATRLGLFFSVDGGRNFGSGPAHRDGAPLLAGQATSVVVVPRPAPATESDVLAVISSVGALLSPLEPGLAPDLAGRAAVAATPVGLHHATIAAGAISAFTLLRSPADGGSGRPPDGTSKVDWKRQGTASIAVYSIGGAVRLADFDALLSEPQNQLHHSLHAANADPTSTSRWRKVSVGTTFNNESARAYYMHAVTLEPPSGANAAPLWINTFQMRRETLQRNAASGAWSWTPGSSRVDSSLVHVDNHAIEVVEGPRLPPAAGTDRHVLSGNDGGFYRRVNGAAFVAQNTHITALFYQLAAASDGAGGLRVIGGLQDNGTVIGEGPPNPANPTDWTWKFVPLGGDGGTAAFVPADPTQLVPVNPTVGLGSTNGFPGFGRAGAVAAAPWTGDTLGETFQGDRAPFSELVAVARAAPTPPAVAAPWSRVYFSHALSRDGLTGGVLRRADDVAPPTATWVPIPTSGRPAVEISFSAMITALCPSPSPGSEAATDQAWPILWVGLADGRLFRSADAGNTFQEVLSLGVRRPITGIAVDPTDARVVAICTAGFAEPALNAPARRVFLTVDGLGSSFSDISGSGATGLPDQPMFGISWARTQPRTLVAVTDCGVVTAIAQAASSAAAPPRFDGRWRRLGAGLPTLTCMGLSVVNGTTDTAIDPAQPAAAARLLPPVVLGTLGRGAWVLAPSTAVVAEGTGAFGPVRLTTTQRRTLVLRNLGTADAALQVPDPPAPFAWVGLSGPAPHAVTVPAGGTASLVASFAPAAAGMFSTVVAVPSGPTLALSGEGVADGPPRLAFARRVVRFGAVAQGTVATTTVALRNGGASPLTLTLPAVAAPFEVTLPSTVLSPGEEVSATVRFSPVSAVGTLHELSVPIGADDPTVASDPGHFTLRLWGTTAAPLPPPPAPPPVVPAPASPGLPGWVPWVIAGGVVVGIGIGIAIGVAVADANNSNNPPPGG